MWLCDSSLHDIMARWWRDCGPPYATAMYSFVKKLQFVKFQLKRWNKLCYGNLYDMKRNAQVHLSLVRFRILVSQRIWVGLSLKL